MVVVRYHFYWIFVFPGHWPWPWPPSSISIYWSPASMCIYWPQSLICVCLFFTTKVCYSYNVYLYKLSLYKLLTCTYFLSIIWEISKLFEISSKELFSIFLIGHNWSHSVHFHFVVQLLQLFHFDLMLREVISSKAWFSSVRLIYSHLVLYNIISTHTGV